MLPPVQNLMHFQKMISLSFKKIWVDLIIFFSIAILTFNSCHTKTSAESNKNGNCIINTTQIEKANGVALEIHYPCSWMEVHLHDDDPQIIKEIGIMPEEINANFGLTVMIRRLKGDVMSSAELDELRDNIYLKRNTSVTDNSLSSDTLEINGIKGGKIITRKVLLSGQVTYTLLIQLYVKENLVQLIYVVGAPTEPEAHSAFQTQEPVFENLASKTKLLSRDEKPE
jgi:hypothetical protein